MYTTLQAVSRGIIGEVTSRLLLHPVQRQNLPWLDSGTVNMVPLTDLRDGHIEVVCDVKKRIPPANPVVVNRTTIPLVSPGRLFDSHLPILSPVANS